MSFKDVIALRGPYGIMDVEIFGGLRFDKFIVDEKLGGCGIEPGRRGSEGLKI